MGPMWHCLKTHHSEYSILTAEGKCYMRSVAPEAGPWFNIKMTSYRYRKSHCGDKTVVRSSYLHNGISYTGKMTSFYWIRAQVSRAGISTFRYLLDVITCPCLWFWHNTPDIVLCICSTRLHRNWQTHAVGWTRPWPPALCQHWHRTARGVMVSTLQSPAAPGLFITTTSGATSNDNVGWASQQLSFFRGCTNRCARASVGTILTIQ